MAERMFGLETEYAFSVLGHHGEGFGRDAFLGQLMDLASSRLPHLPGMYSKGMFLANGARFYLDCGNHPELTTPEVTNPWDAVRYILAGERLLAGLAGDVARGHSSIAQVFFTRCNVCYGGTCSSWGCHESFAHRAAPADLPRQLIPHLVSRLIYSGSGGFNNQSPGIEFMLSPRVGHLSKDVSSESTHSRGIFHTKDEALSSHGFHRLHLICGESLCSETAMWLKTATTALVVALAEAGLKPGEMVQLRDPLEAMRRFASDPSCRAAVVSAQGAKLTALAIQRHYLRLAEQHAADSFMPPWAHEACQQWRAILDRLEKGPSAVARTLDWAIKLALYQDRACRRGLAWETLAHWNDVLGQLQVALQQGDGGENRAEDNLIDVDVKRLTPLLRARGLDGNKLRPFLALRQELFEIDTRFGQLGEQSIFAGLERAGVLDHHIAGVDNIDHALTNPPTHSRARLRGDCVRRFAGNNGCYKCDWTGVWDQNENRYLDLSHPFTAEENWQEVPPQAAPADSWHTHIRAVLNMVREKYVHGHYERAHELLRDLSVQRDRFDPGELSDYLRFTAWTQSRRGFLDGIAALDEIPRSEPLSFSALND